MHGVSCDRAVQRAGQSAVETACRVRRLLGNWYLPASIVVAAVFAAAMSLVLPAAVDAGFASRAVFVLVYMSGTFLLLPMLTLCKLAEPAACNWTFCDLGWLWAATVAATALGFNNAVHPVALGAGLGLVLCAFLLVQFSYGSAGVEHGEAP